MSFDPQSKSRGLLASFFVTSFDGVLVNHGGSDIAMSKQFLDSANIVICLKKVAGKTMPKIMSGSPGTFLQLRQPPDKE